MSERRIIDFQMLENICFTAKDHSEAEELFNALPKPTLADVCGKRKLDSLMEEGAREYEKKFVSIKYHGATLATRIRVIKQNIACDDISIRMTKWFLDHGFNVWEVGE